MTDGHAEVEITLLRLFRSTGTRAYLDPATSLQERRGRVRGVPTWLLTQSLRAEKRKKIVRTRRLEFLADHPDQAGFKLPSDNYAKSPHFTRLRWRRRALSGKYLQIHLPLEKPTVPVGHSVRLGYLETTAVTLARLSGDRRDLPQMEQTWEHVVAR